MKTLETLEQEAKQAREEAIKEVSQYVPNAIEVTDKLILAISANKELEKESISKSIDQLSCVAKELTMQMQILSKNLIKASEQMKELQMCSTSSIEITGDGSGNALPEASQDQKEVDADGWVSWNGGSCPVNKNEIVDLKFGSGHIRYGTDTKYKWEGTGARDCDIVAYRVAKAYPCKVSKE